MFIAERLQTFLDAQPLHSLLRLIDRLLVVHIVADAAAVAKLRALMPPLYARSNDVVDLLVASALAPDVVAGAAERARLSALVNAARIDLEPHASVFRYWRRRAGFDVHGDVRDVVGADPHDAYFALYHHAHAVFFAADYGTRRVARALYGPRVAAAVVAAHDASEPLLIDNGDALAEILLAEACLTPADDDLRTHLVDELTRLQRDDGSIAMPAGADADAIHHAACVAYAAVTLVERERVFRRARSAR